MQLWLKIYYWLLENCQVLLEILSSLTIAGCAVFALHTWKKEFIGKKKIELAAELVEQAIQLKNFIAFVRNGVTYTHERKETKEFLQKNNKEIKENHLMYLVPRLRLKQNEEALETFFKLRAKAYMYWGEDVLKIFDLFSHILIQITTSSNVLYEEIDELEKNSIKKHQEIIWPISTENDELGLILEMAVQELKFNLEPLYRNEKFKWEKIKEDKTNG